MRLGAFGLFVVAGGAVAAGCGRSGPFVPEDGEAGHHHVPVPRISPFSSPAVSPTPTPVPLCDPLDAQLLACFGFDATTSDGSAHAVTPATANLAFAPGVDGSALLFSAASGFILPDDDTLDPPGPTLELWLRPDMLPGAGNRMGIFDKDGQYGVFLFADGSASCVCGGNSVAVPAGTFAAGVWSHVACVLGPADVELYVDGAIVAAAGSGCPGSTGGSGLYVAENGTAGNDQLAGRIDRMRIWGRPRTPTELCEEAGTCPDG